MPLETAQFINTLQSDWPTGTDPESMGDDHIRMIKQVLQNTFPKINCAISGDGANLNAISMGLQYVAADPDGFNANHWTARDSAGANMIAVAVGQSTATNRALYPNQATCWADIINVLMPVGHILLTRKAGNPSTWLGFGTWVQRGGYLGGAGVAVLDAAGLSETLGLSNGSGWGNWRIQNSQIVSQQLTLAMDAVAPHKHSFSYTSFETKSNFDSGSGGAGKPITANGNTGDGGGHTPAGKVTIGSGTATSGTAYMPPYYGCYVWERTA